MNTYDVAIAGGGLAGLASAILYAQKGYKVVLFEKKQYPFHRVCGEYVSKESDVFLAGLGLDLSSLGAADLSSFQMSHPNGKTLTTELPLGGRGISRFLLDDKLADLALDAGVVLLQGTEVNAYTYHEKSKTWAVKSGEMEFSAKLFIGAYGKISRLASQENTPDSPHDNYVGVKYHLRSEQRRDQISLHLFDKGYAGFSSVEEDKFCFCYMVAASRLKEEGNSIEALEAAFAQENPQLQALLDDAEKVNPQPTVISGIKIDKKRRGKRAFPLIGDAVATIAPLAGNGMSMAFGSAKLLVENSSTFLEDKMPLPQLLKKYDKAWNSSFSSRIKSAHRLQNLLFSPVWSSRALSLLKPFPALARTVIKSTHGQKI